MKTRVLSLFLVMILSISISGCSSAPQKVKLTAETNTNIDNIIHVLKEKYQLSETAENKLSLSATPTDKENVYDGGSVDMTLYFDTDDLDIANEAVKYIFQRLSAMCTPDSSFLVFSYIYLLVDECYVNHSMYHFYDDMTADDVCLNITEFDSDTLKQCYEMYKEEYNLSDYTIHERNGIKYIDPRFEIEREPILDKWEAKVLLSTAEDYSVNELIDIGELFFQSLRNEVKSLANQTNFTGKMHEYTITIYGAKYQVSGTNNGTDTLVWDSKEISDS